MTFQMRIRCVAGAGLDEACASILSQRLGRDVFIIGAANVGKSAFVRRMLKEMANMTSRHFDTRATLAGRKLPVESAMPGTTLGFVKLGAFSSGGALYDTPGVLLLHSKLHAVLLVQFWACL
jgi:nitric-oxide synthase, plant